MSIQQTNSESKNSQCLRLVLLANSLFYVISEALFCLKKQNKNTINIFTKYTSCTSTPQCKGAQNRPTNSIVKIANLTIYQWFWKANSPNNEHYQGDILKNELFCRYNEIVIQWKCQCCFVLHWLSLCEPKRLKRSTKYLPLCSTPERKSYRFEITWWQKW